MKIVIYCITGGSAPLLRWLDKLPPRAIAKCHVKIERLRQFGHDLRRPEADYLGDNIYELRTRLGHTNYRLLYFFHGRKAVVLSHGFEKQRGKLPQKELNLAMKRMKSFMANPKAHTYEVT